MKTILLTGSAGRIGTSLRQYLGDCYHFRCLDLQTTANVEEMIVGDVTDFNTVIKAMSGVDAVIHLAANPDPNQSWQDVYTNSINGTYNVFEAAKQLGISKIIYASTTLVSDWRELRQKQQINSQSLVLPDSFYGTGKLLGENLGRIYAKKYDASVICLRIGDFTENIQPKSKEDLILSTWCSPKDFAQLVQKCLDSDLLGFQIFYAISNNKRRFWDLSNSQKLVNYEPEDNAEDFLIPNDSISLNPRLNLQQKWIRSSRRAWAYYLQFYKSVYIVLLISAVASIGQSLLVVPAAGLIRYIFDYILPAKDLSLLVWAGLGLVGINFLTSLIALGNRYITLKITKTVIKKLRQSLLAKLYNLPRSYYTNSDISKLHTLIVQDTERVDVMSNALISQFLPSVAFSFVLCGILIYLNPYLFLLLLVFMPLIIGINRFMARSLKQKVNQFQRSFENFSKGILFVLRVMDFTKIQSAEALEMKRQRQYLKDLETTSMGMAWLQTAFSFAQNTTLTLSKLAVLIIGAIAVATDKMTLGELLAFFVTANLLNGYFQGVLAAIPQIITGNESLVPLFDFWHLQETEPYFGKKCIDFQGEINLESVDFFYRDRQILKNLNLKLLPQTITAIAGENGAGKSTLIYLILGFYRPHQGQIYMDNIPLEQLNMQTLRRQVGVVMQDVEIFRGTVWENITYGSENPRPEAVIEASQNATAHEFIEKLAQGYDTFIGEKGVLLSGGQRQRIALARALLGNPKLLILDEPTNHLDTKAIAKFMQNIKALPTPPTILIITHNLDVIEQADYIYSLKNGCLEII